MSETDIPITQMYPNHMSRTNGLVTEGANWISKGIYYPFNGLAVLILLGGFIDFTADDTGNHTLAALMFYKFNKVVVN